MSCRLCSKLSQLHIFVCVIYIIIITHISPLGTICHWQILATGKGIITECCIMFVVSVSGLVFWAGPYKGAVKT